MGSNTAAVAPHENLDQEAGALRVWRVCQLARIGLAWPVAEAVADTVDWHEVANLVRRGCPAALAVMIIQ